MVGITASRPLQIGAQGDLLLQSGVFAHGGGGA
jgi:hypothetical protein